MINLHNNLNLNIIIFKKWFKIKNVDQKMMCHSLKKLLNKFKIFY